MKSLADFRNRHNITSRDQEISLVSPKASFGKANNKIPFENHRGSLPKENTRALLRTENKASPYNDSRLIE